ncbi:MAG: hypothetical protein WAN43_15935 [Rhodomicrobium sp.]
MLLLSEEILKQLAGVEGRYIEWEWDIRTLTGDLVAMRESDGLPVNIDNADGRNHTLKVPLRALEELIQADFVSEDPSKRTAGFRLYRVNAEGRKRCARDLLS